jgi:hypothetical protein
VGEGSEERKLMKVFVSSTYEDLVQHREAVFRILDRLTQQHRGMECFGARPDDPKTACFKEIAACQAFVGIYAHRYGWIPPGDKLSITEQEFDFALSRGLDMYCYVVNPDHPWPPRYTKDADSPALRRLINKVNRFVRARFTTPDDLAKQVAADLNVAFLKPRSQQAKYETLRQSFAECCAREIATTVGKKYIKDLYVSRQLEVSVLRSLAAPQQMPESLALIRNGWTKIIEFLSKWKVTAPKPSVQTAARQGRATSKCSVELEKLCALTPQHSDLCYPSPRLQTLFSSMRQICTKSGKYIERYARKDDREKWDRLKGTLFKRLDRFERELRPIALVVDRAGGGKTNILCRITEQMAASHPCIFFIGRSILEPTKNGILDYVSSVYRITEDPLTTALDCAGHAGQQVIIIIDAINENLHPVQFNEALKAFVSRYYGKSIRFLVSCRDIYWSYFEDEWWEQHCSSISRGELYSFSQAEQDKALSLYFAAYHIVGRLVGYAQEQLRHPLLLRFFCEAFAGTLSRPSPVGDVKEIRLLELFDAYCERKFSSIRQKLHLMSSDEVFIYLEMIAMLMLERKARLLPVRLVAQRAHERFGEHTIRSVESRYVQILDEDILLEEKPTGKRMNLQVGFVYDEFMEYVIARGLWAEMTDRKSVPQLRALTGKVTELLSIRESFVTVLGIVVYLGELLANQKRKAGLEFVHWLIKKGHIDLALGIVEKWPHDARGSDVFGILIHLHDERQSEDVRSQAWQAMQRMSAYYWKEFFAYIQQVPKKGSYKFANVFTALKKVDGGPSSSARMSTLRWIARLFREEAHLKYRGSQDNICATVAMNHIVSCGDARWSKREKREAHLLLTQMPGANLSRSWPTGRTPIPITRNLPRLVGKCQKYGNK